MIKKVLPVSIISLVFAMLLLSPCRAEGLGSRLSSGALVTVSKDTSRIASEEEMTSVEEVTWEGMEPVGAEKINDGAYEITVDSSSSMFKITHCLLTVREGKMSALMTMGGKGYLYLFMGTPEEAAAAKEDEFIPFYENASGEHTFTVPVESLDAPVKCAAFSKKKEQWYDRTLVFRSSSLPLNAFKESKLVTAGDLGLLDGDYRAEVSLTGGSGKAKIESPAALKVENGQITAVIVWSSKNYDYMLVDDKKYFTVNEEGNSTFEIPAAGFDCPLPVIADTVAMSRPHEIAYTLLFDSATLRPVLTTQTG